MNADVRDVVVVGGGPAGMSAAWNLADTDVLLLEQRDHLGGRLRSLPRGDYWMNLGGHLFPGAGSRVHDMISDLGVATIEIPGSKTALYFGGKVYPARRAEAFPLVLPLTLGERLSMAGAGLRVRRHVKAWIRATKARAGESESARKTRLSAFESDRTFRDLLGTLPEPVDAIFRSAARRAAGEIDEQSAGVGISLFGALWVGKGSGSQLNILGGSSMLGEAVLRRLGDDAVVGATVVSIEQSADRARVRYETDGGMVEVTARRVIVATPADVARSLVQGLPADVDGALASVTYGPFVCMGVITGEKGPMLWDGIYAMTTPGMAFDMLFNHANPLRGPGPRAEGGSLMCYAGGRPARELLALPDAEIERRFRADLCTIYPQLHELIREVVVQKWRIGNVFRTPRTRFNALIRHRDQPTKIVHFAGDYFAELGGTIEEATKSGLEAAAAVRAELAALTPRD